MSHVKSKMHRIRFPASVRSSFRSSVRLFFDTVDESQRRRHGVTAAIVVDVVGALRPCVALCPSVRPSLRWSLTLNARSTAKQERLIK